MALEFEMPRDSTRLFTAGGSARTLNHADAGKIVQLDTLAGTTITLPAASGSGDLFRFATTLLATSNSHVIKVANATDIMAGALVVVDNADATTTTFGCAADSDTITLNRTTKGSVRIGGDNIFIQDIASGVFMVWGTCTGTGGEATPFSATV